MKNREKYGKNSQEEDNQKYTVRHLIQKGENFTEIISVA